MLDNLNEMQLKAIKHKDGPLLILAGAGSGKTRVLTTKIAYLIKEEVLPYNILAITFTNKAANEMKERIEALVGKTNITACTFHSFGVKILRENYKELGYDSNFVIMDSDDTLTLIKKILKDMNIDPKVFSPYLIRNKISSNKNEFVMPDEYKKFVYGELEDVVHKVYVKYQEILFKNNSVDFDDLLILPIKLFKKNQEILNKYQERYKYILIDEYQDTNQAQYLLSKMIADKYRNICVSGDFDQAIYMFRGANFRNILNFEKDYKDCEVVLLEQNYRSTKNILDAANSVIKNNDQRKDKNLWSDNKEGSKLTYFKAFDETDEVFYIIRKIKELINNGVSLKEIAILYRTNAQSRVFEQEFLRENIPFRIIGSFYFYSRKEIKDLLSYLRLINNLKDDVSLLRVINSPKRGIGNKTISDLEQKAIFYNSTIFDAIESGKEVVFKNIILELIEDSKTCSLTELIDKVLDKSGMRQSLKEEHSLEADIRLENLEEFKSVTKAFEENVGIISLDEFLLEVALVSDIEEYKDDPNRVTLMTVHSVKGLEFPYVFISGLEEGLFPHMNSMNSKDELEEERRLMYVALTRAKEKLFLTNTKRRMIYGRETPSISSRFIGEIEDDLIDFENVDERKPLKKEKLIHETDQEYKYGDKVIHDVYGEGVVIEIASTILTVAFKNGIGIKKILKNHKSIRKA